MKLHPPEFTAEPGEPFANDRLERQTQVKSFCQMLLDVEGHAIVSLDGPWGSGKTAFTKMCAAYLRSEESRDPIPAGVVEFNAWQQGHTGSPLIDLVSALSAKVGNETKNKLIQDAFKLGARVVTHVVSVATHGLLDLEVLSNNESRDITTAWEDAENGTNDFKEHLARAVEPDGLVVLIDELDRCSPSYTLELLSTVRHLFDVDGVVVVMAINRAELVNGVQSVYGADFNADRYLRRFADLHARLLPPAKPEFVSFFKQTIEATGESSLGERGMWEMLSLVGEAEGCSLRDVQQAMYHYSAVVASFSPADRIGLSNLQFTTAVLIVFRTLDHEAYQRLTAGQIDGFEAIVALRESLTPAGASRPSVADRDIRDLEAVLFGFASSGDRPVINEDDFIREYHIATGSEDGVPADVFRRHEDWTRAMHWPLSLGDRETITVPIDMFSSA